MSEEYVDVFTRLVGVVNNITYKPGWVFTPERMVEGWGYEGAVLKFRYTSVDRDTGQPCLLQGQSYPFYKSMSDAEILRQVHHAICNAERHEIDEFFCYQGVRVYDPHKEK